MPASVNILGSATVDLNSDGSLLSSSGSLSASSTPISVAVTTQSSGDWNSGSLWGDTGQLSLFFDPGFSFQASSSLAWSELPDVNLLQAGGPTNGATSIAGVLVATGTSATASFDLQTSLLYDVSINSAVTVDQQPVDISSLALGSGASVSVDSVLFAVDHGASGGLLQAQNGGTVSLSGVLTDITLSASGSGLVTLRTGAVLSSTTITGGIAQIIGGQSARLSGTLDNSGTIEVLGALSPSTGVLGSGGNASTFAELQVGTATLTGHGTIALDGGGDNRLAVANLGATSLVNQDNTIEGHGTVGNSNLSLTNAASGVISADIAGTVLDVAALTNQGTIGASNGGTLVVAAVSGTGTISVGATSTVEVQGALDGQAIVLSGTGAVFQWDNPTSTSATLTLGQGQTIDLQNVGSNSVSFDSSTGSLSFTASGSSQTVTLQSGGLGLQVSYTGNDAILTTCFCPGTLIATPDGERRIEDLQVGDWITTLSGRPRRIIWIGYGSVLNTRWRRTAATPVTIRKGAFADNVPHHDLRVTKGHSFLLDGVLIPVEFLVNHRSIEWHDRAEEVSFFHIELGTHDVILANGAPAETYRDDGNRWLFRNANNGWHLPPQPPCAPVLTGGPVVDAIWRRLLDRSGPRPGFPLTEDPDLHLRVDGRRVDATARYPDLFEFRLTQPPGTVVIASRAGSPAELGHSRDPRLLGVAVRRITLQRHRQLRTLEAGDPSLQHGFHAYEPELGLRWTSGEATLPANLLQDFGTPLDLVVHTAGSTRYPLIANARLQSAA